MPVPIVYEISGDTFRYDLILAFNQCCGAGAKSFGRRLRTGTGIEK
jgi:hypothetical protein